MTHFDERFPMQEPTSPYKDPTSPEEQAAAESLRRKIAGFRDPVIEHVTKLQTVTPEIDEATHRVIQFPARSQEASDEQVA